MHAVMPRQLVAQPGGLMSVGQLVLVSSGVQGEMVGA